MKKYDLIEGSISHSIINLAIPIMATSFFQMAYNLVDMIWIGKLGTISVAAVGTAGFYMWFSMSLMRLLQTSTEVNVSQAIGRKEFDLSNKYISIAIKFSIVFSLIYLGILLGFNEKLIAFFNIKDKTVVNLARNYLYIVAFGMPFSFVKAVISSTYNATGDSKTPFKINSIGLVLNIVLDPIFIFVFNFGVVGAALATVISQIFVTLIMIKNLKQNVFSFGKFRYIKDISLSESFNMLKIGFPTSLQSALFTFFAMLIGRNIASFGAAAIAAQKVGIQIESISYMTANGFSVALSTFVGQNYGAKKYLRLKKGIIFSSLTMSIYGIIISIILFVFAENIFKIFISDFETLKIGVVYIKILALSQMFMCLEITLAGGFNGLGKTTIPAVISIVFTGARVPLSYYLSNTLLGVTGIWWTISMTSVVKGLIIAIGTIILFKCKYGIKKLKDNSLNYVKF